MTSRWIAFVRGAWRQLPVETAIVAAAAVGAIGLNHDHTRGLYMHLFLAGLVATPLAFAARRLERFGRHVPLVAGAVAAAGVFAAVSCGPHAAGELNDAAFRWPYLLSLLAAMLVPFVMPGPGFARFVRRFFEQTTTWGVLCGTGIAAVQVVTLAVTELFDLRVRRLGDDASILVGCGFVLTYLYRLRADEAAGGRIPELWRRLATTVGAPFVSAMLAILAVYEVLARARGELPRNMLSPLILAAGLVGFVSTLIVSAVLDEAGGTGVLAPADPHRWARRWSVRLTRAFPVVLLALLPMAWWALWLRIGQHGITPFRAVRGMGLVCLTGLGALGAWRWLRGGAALSWQVPAALAVFALVTAFGPASAVELSIRSQAARAAAILDEAGAGRAVAAMPVVADPRDPPPATPTSVQLSAERFAALRGAIELLAELGGEPAVRRVLTGAVTLCANRWQIERCLEQLGVREIGGMAPSTRNALLTLRGRVRVPAGAAEPITLTRWEGAPDPGRASRRGDPGDQGGSADGLWLGPDDIVLRTGGLVVAEASLAPLMVWSDDGALPARTVALVRPDGTLVVELAVTELQLRGGPGEPPQVVHLSGIAIWPP